MTAFHHFLQHTAMRASSPNAPLAGTNRTGSRWAFEVLRVERIESLAPRSDRNREVDSKAEVDGT